PGYWNFSSHAKTPRSQRKTSLVMIPDVHDGRFALGGQAHPVAAQQVAVNAAATCIGSRQWDIALKGNRRPWTFFESIPPDKRPAATHPLRRQRVGVRSRRESIKFDSFASVLPGKDSRNQGTTFVGWCSTKCGRSTPAGK